MVETIEGAVDLVTTICRRGGAGDFIQATNALAAERGLVEAVANRDTPTLYGWLMESFSFQGISDRIAWSYIEDHGNASWFVVEAGLEATRCQCPKLGSFETYSGCRYRKIPRTCAEPTFIDGCPVPTLPLRKGDLNQLAYSLYYFLRDRCDGDLVGFIDRLFALAVAEGPADPIAAKRAALISEISKVFAVSQKLIAMTFSVLLMGGRPSRPDWIAVGRSLIAVDSLVHNFLHRTGILSAYGCNHPYGDRCYGKSGCATVLHDLAARIDATAINPIFPGVFPRLVQFSIWQFCAETGANICNGRRIDDRFGCTNFDCPAGQTCSRIPLRSPPIEDSQPI